MSFETSIAGTGSIPSHGSNRLDSPGNDKVEQRATSTAANTNTRTFRARSASHAKNPRGLLDSSHLDRLRLRQRWELAVSDAGPTGPEILPTQSPRGQRKNHPEAPHAVRQRPTTRHTSLLLGCAKKQSDRVQLAP
jgi:hypothetical protein